MMMLSSVTNPVMMTTTTMRMMPPSKKARHSYSSYLNTDRIFFNNCSSNDGSGLGRDDFSPRSMLQSSNGSQVSRELSMEIEEFRFHGTHPDSQSRALPAQGSSPRTTFHQSYETSMPKGFSLDFSMVGPDPSTQRTSRAFDIEHTSLRVDTIELPRRTTTTPSCGAEANEDAPLDLTTLSADKLKRTLDDQTSPRSVNSTPTTVRLSGAGYDFRSESDGGQRLQEKRPQLPLFVNLENSRLESIQLGLHPERGHGISEKENDETKSVPSGWKRMRDFEIGSEVEQPPRRQKNAIDRLRAHLERRQESMPPSSTAYDSLSKHLAVIEATGNRFEATHDTMLGEPQGGKATRMKTSFRSVKEIDAREQSYSHFHFEKEIPIRNPEESDKQKRSLPGLTNGGSQKRQYGQRLKGTDNDNTLRAGHSSGVEFERHPTDRCHISDQSMGQVQTDIQLQGLVLAETPLDLHPSKHPNFGVWIHASEAIPIIRGAGRPRRPEADAEPDSPSSHSLPDFSRRSDPAASTQSQTSRRPASIGTGFPSSEKQTTKNDEEAAVVMDMDGNGGGFTLEASSPDQSTNYMNYSADNLPAVIASARLDDDCEFTASFAEAPKETKARDHLHPMDKSPPKASFRNRKTHVRSGSVGTTLSSSPEPPSSTFEDESVSDKTRDDENNAKPTESAIPCKICQDIANGFHYGVWSCEGCKAFFKRSITGSAKYVCPADNNCTINRLRKKSCQACRLRKCYEYGMSPGNCRGENGSKMRKRKLPEADRNEDTRNVNGINGDDRRMNNASNQSNALLHVPNGHHNFHGHPTVAEPSSGPESILQHLLAVERPIRFADFTDVRTAMDAVDSDRIQWLTSITKLVNLQLMDVVTWSRSLPGFRTLNQNIRTHLLVSSWSEILLLTNAFYSMQCTNAIAMAPNLHLNRERCEVIGVGALYNRLMAIVKSFQQLALTHNEMLLMQVLLLVNADLTAPQLIPRLDGLRSNLMRSWHQSCAAGSQGPVDYDRIPRLLMLLPHIRHCSFLFQRFLADVRRDTRIPFNGFLQEVTDGRHEFDQVSVLELIIEEEAGRL